jgi:hypothetical protein
MPSERKCKPASLTLTDTEIEIFRIFMDDRDVGCKLTIGDLLNGEYSEHLAPLNDSQKLQFLAKLERLGVL